MDKKGQGISMTYIVIAALALIVLIVIFLFFTGGMERMFEKITKTTDSAGQEFALLISQCKIYCSTENKPAWDGFKKEEYSSGCSDASLLGAGYWEKECEGK